MLSSTNGMAQVSWHTEKKLSNEQQEVLEVVLRVFDSMREGDSAKLHTAFTDDVAMYTSFTDKDGNAQLRKGELQQFLNAIGTPHQQRYDEPLWNIDVKLDGHVAMLWADYAFYLDKQFSHCGVDAFMLHHFADGWKIYQLTDTRKKEGCQVPDIIKKDRTE